MLKMLLFFALANIPWFFSKMDHAFAAETQSTDAQDKTQETVTVGAQKWQFNWHWKCLPLTPVNSQQLSQIMLVEMNQFTAQGWEFTALNQITLPPNQSCLVASFKRPVNPAP